MQDATTDSENIKSFVEELHTDLVVLTGEILNLTEAEATLTDAGIMNSKFPAMFSCYWHSVKEGRCVNNKSDLLCF